MCSMYVSIYVVKTGYFFMETKYIYIFYVENVNIIT